MEHAAVDHQLELDPQNRQRGEVDFVLEVMCLYQPKTQALSLSLTFSPGPVHQREKAAKSTVDKPRVAQSAGLSIVPTCRQQASSWPVWIPLTRLATKVGHLEGSPRIYSSTTLESDQQKMRSDNLKNACWESETLKQAFDKTDE
ncbi:hypothetical protein TKK_0002873 [Trichogramma kaykai]